MNKVLKMLAGAISAAAAYMALIMPRINRPSHEGLKDWYYAHRGFHDNKRGAPENSLAAFRQAVAHGYGIELDVQLTKDNQLVVFHDFTLSRVCGIDRKVRDMTLLQLRRLTLFDTDEYIPTFQEALETVSGRVPLIIELKTNDVKPSLPRMVNLAMEGYEGVYCIESFNPGALYWYRKNRPDIIRGQLSTNFYEENGKSGIIEVVVGKLLINILSRPDFIAYNWMYRYEISRRICCGLFHAIPVAWTIRTQEELDSCRKDFRMFIFEGFHPDGELADADLASN